MADATAYPCDLAPPQALIAVERWLARRSAPVGPTWCAFADPDGAVGLIPSGRGSETCSALLFTEQTGGYGVTACDSEDPVEVGVFATIEDALQGVSHWMTPVIADGLGTARVAATSRHRPEPTT